MNNSRQAHRVAAAGALAALGLGVSVGAAQAGTKTAHAQKVPLTTANINCDGSSTGGRGTGPGQGFVVYNRPADGSVIAVVVLQDARPNTAYTVRVIKSDGDCGIVDGVITTDGLGDGSVNVHEDVAVGGTVFAAVNNAADPASDYLTTGVVRP